jgi:predicted DNA-binding protein (UPF0251 family)
LPRGYRWRKGVKRCGRGRPQFSRKISKIPRAKGFLPIQTNQEHPISPEDPFLNAPISLDLDELEAMRLVDLENLTQDEAGNLMNISRGSIWRLLQSGRRKLINAIFESREIRINIENLENNPEI